MLCWNIIQMLSMKNAVKKKVIVKHRNCWRRKIGIIRLL